MKADFMVSVYDRDHGRLPGLGGEAKHKNETCNLNAFIAEVAALMRRGNFGGRGRGAMVFHTPTRLLWSVDLCEDVRSVFLRYAPRSCSASTKATSSYLSSGRVIHATLQDRPEIISAFQPTAQCWSAHWIGVDGQPLSIPQFHKDRIEAVKLAAARVPA